MNILVINPSECIPPRLVSEVETLIGLGNSVQVINWDREGVFGAVEENTDGYLRKWVHVPAAFGAVGVIRALPRLYSAIWKNIEDEHLDVVHSSHIYMLPFALWIAKRKKCKIVYDAMERYSIDLAYRYAPYLRIPLKIILEAIENSLVRRVNGVLTITSPGDVISRRYSRFCSNTTVLFNVPSVEMDINEDEVNMLRNRYRGRKVVTCVGSVSRERGMTMLIEMLGILVPLFPEILLHVIGPSNSKEFVEDIKGLVKDMGIEDNIEFVPTQPYSNLLQYLMVSQVGLVSYLDTDSIRMYGRGTSRKLFTYMHAGVPVVSTNYGEYAKVVEETGCGVVVDGLDPMVFASAVEGLLCDRKRVSEMGALGKKAIKEKYNWEREADKLVHVYENL